MQMRCVRDSGPFEIINCPSLADVFDVLCKFCRLFVRLCFFTNFCQIVAFNLDLVL
jgi:hypothetical protein